MKLEHFIEMRALESAYISTNERFIDHMLSDEEKAEEHRKNLRLRRVQFDAYEPLIEEMDSLCQLLECSRRQFLEGAMVDAIEKARSLYAATLERVADPDGQLTLDVVEG